MSGKKAEQPDCPSVSWPCLTLQKTCLAVIRPGELLIAWQPGIRPDRLRTHGARRTTGRHSDVRASSTNGKVNWWQGKGDACVLLQGMCCTSRICCSLSCSIPRMAAESGGHAGEGVCQAGMPPHCWACHNILWMPWLSCQQCRVQAVHRGAGHSRTGAAAG